VLTRNSANADKPRDAFVQYVRPNGVSDLKNAAHRMCYITLHSSYLEWPKVKNC